MEEPTRHDRLVDKSIIPVCTIMGVNIAAINMEWLVEFTKEHIKELSGDYMCVSNVHTTVMSYDDQTYCAVQNGGIMAIPDGGPLSSVGRKRGFKTGVITNGPSVLQHTKMENSGLLPYMDILVVSGDLEFAKPQPEIFEYTASKLGLKTEDCIYVGDHPVNDIQGALSAGMHALRMNWGWFKNQDLRPDVPVIASLSEVINYVS